MQENNCLKLVQMSNWKNEQHLNIDQNFYHQMSQVRVNVSIQTVIYIFDNAPIHLMELFKNLYKFSVAPFILNVN